MTFLRAAPASLPLQVDTMSMVDGPGVRMVVFEQVGSGICVELPLSQQLLAGRVLREGLGEGLERGAQFQASPPHWSSPTHVQLAEAARGEQHALL